MIKQRQYNIPLWNFSRYKSRQCMRGQIPTVSMNRTQTDGYNTRSMLNPKRGLGKVFKAADTVLNGDRGAWAAELVVVEPEPSQSPFEPPLPPYCFLAPSSSATSPHPLPEDQGPVTVPPNNSLPIILSSTPCLTYLNLAHACTLTNCRQPGAPRPRTNTRSRPGAGPKLATQAYPNGALARSRNACIVPQCLIRSPARLQSLVFLKVVVVDTWRVPFADRCVRPYLIFSSCRAASSGISL